MERLLNLEDHIPALRRYAFALLRGRDDADDLVQGSLLRAIDGMENRRGTGDLRPWLFSIMHNLFVNQWRRRRVLGAVMVDHPDADVAVAADQDAGIELHDVLRRLDRLPDDQRAVLLLVAVEGLDYASAASTLGIPIGTVMSRLSRARDRLRDAPPSDAKSVPGWRP
ncbi:sigma-70 family RNA polymerase sigma factor [Sphingomonas sp. PAMC26645]|uniref:sigma-70 family RNA polymerase sigma factor n=1 Tax=Sphingomonas sp. PAMC26645 TaxID=2565555 RepID=UPI00109DA089|nr:sigma-70 family RNA polymerase sigma factor [Sphingomonas sp. PAMC26645]QCB43290.1 sigma-70 family RNA polymerase sigma factor [Sphingomonas sp. PAMC26645]